MAVSKITKGVDFKGCLVYKTAMVTRYFPHLSTILFMHAVLLLGSWQMMSPEARSRALQLGPTALKLQIAQVLLAEPQLPKAETRSQSKMKPQFQQTEAVPTVTEVSPSGVSQELKANLREVFKAELRSRIEQNKYYPPMSRRLGQTGIVIVAFTLLGDGHIINVRIDTPSRYESLNNSALDAVKKVHVFKAIPKELGESQMDIKVPLKFVTI